MLRAPHTSHTWHDWPAAVGVVVLALAVRLLYLFEAASLPTFGRPTVDAALYVDAARRFAETGELPAVFFKPPLYPVLLGAWWRCVGEDWIWLRLPFLGLGGVTTWLVWWAGKRCFGPVVATAAASLYALHKSAVYFDAELLEIGVATCVQFAGFAATLWCADTASRARRFACGLLLGLGCVARPVFFPFTIAALVWLGWRRLGPTAAGMLLAIAPVTLHNAVRGHDFVVVSANAGVNLYIGNNPNANGRIASTPEFPAQPAAMQRGAQEIAERAAGRPLRPSESSAYWMRRAVEYAVQHPARTLALFGRKLVFCWHGATIGDNDDIVGLDRYVRTFRFLPIGMWCVAPLALAGLITLCVRQRRGPGRRSVQLLAAYVGLQIAALLPFFVVERFRMPWTPALCIAAAWLLVTLAHQRQRAWRAAAGALLGLAACNAPILGVQARPLLDLDYKIAYAYQQQGDIDAAITAYRRAVQHNPRAALARNALGYLLAERGENLDEAVRLIEEAMRLDPTYRANYAESLAFAHLQRRDARAALAACDIGLAANPDTRTRAGLERRRAEAREMLGARPGTP